MPLGGKLVLKGGESLGGGIKKKKKNKKDKELVDEPGEGQLGLHQDADKDDPSKPKPTAPTAVNVMSGKNYEQEFELETQRMQTGKQRSTPWGSTYRAAPEILHGYTRKVTGASAEERLDMRAAVKSDKFCK